MGSWTLDDIPWDHFDRSELDPDVVQIVKAASLVEYNGRSYAHHLCRIFYDDPDFQRAAQRWGDEEIQHGGHWRVGLRSPTRAMISNLPSAAFKLAIGSTSIARTRAAARVRAR